MAHSAALYTVRVKKRYRDYQPLGDLDRSGTALEDVLDRYLTGFEQRAPEGDRVVRSLRHSKQGDDLETVMLHGQRGVVADIVNDEGRNEHRQISTDTQLIRCSGLFRLPPTQDLGWLALQVNNGRGIKGLLEVGLSVRFRDEFDDLMLQIRPFVRGSALHDAIEEGKLSKVRLIRYEKPDDRAVAETDNWVKAGEFGKIELVLSARGRGQMLKSGPLRRFFGGEVADSARADILEFGDIPFEQAKVEVEIDGRIRTFNIESPESGHPMTVELDDLDFDAEGEPMEESVMAGLRDALEYV